MTARQNVQLAAFRTGNVPYYDTLQPTDISFPNLYKHVKIYENTQRASSHTKQYCSLTNYALNYYRRQMSS